MSESDVNDILSRKGAVMVEKANELARAISGVKAAQVRNFYGSVLRIEAKLESLSPDQIATELQLLRPKLAYMVNRESGARPLQKVFDRLLKAAANRVGPETQQARDIAACVVEFAEAVVAYHREHRRS